MTVNELLQKLVELAQRGRGTWEVLRGDETYDPEPIRDVVCFDESKEVVVE